MSRKLTIALCVFSFVFLGMSSSFAAVENIKVSGDINSEFYTRDLGLGEASFDNDEVGFISQIRLRFEADLTEGINTVLQFISERGWGEDSSADDLEINLAYLELNEFFYEPLTLIIGRQDLRYGNGFIVGAPDTNQGKLASGTSVPTGLPTIVQDLSLNKSFDAARIILDFAPWTIDLVFAQVDEGPSTASNQDDEILLGFNVAYSMGSHGEVSELYFFSADNTPQSTSTDTNDNVHVVGARTFFHLSEQFSVGLEGAYQFGSYRVSATDHDRIKAGAGQFVSQYRFDNDYDAKIDLTYTYTSGDDQATPEVYEGWNPMWEDQTPTELFNILLPNGNRRVFTLSGSMIPREDLTIGLVYARGWVVEKFTSVAILNAMGPIAGRVFYIDNSKKHLADEWNIYAIYDFSEDVQLKASFAWLKPGTVFNQRNDNNCYSVRTGINVSF